jgi:methionyl-tRNA formyltransferase
VPTLRALLEAGHQVAAVYTRPDQPAGRSRRLQPTPVRAAAEALGLPVETPTGLRSAEVQHSLASLRAEVFIVAAYGRILPPDVLAIPRYGVVNIHPSLLPRYRGPSPVATAILEGAAETGVSIMLLDEGMDTGPVLARSIPVRLDGTERAGELTARLFEMGAAMLPQVLRGLEAGELKPEPQKAAAATVTRLIEKEDGRIDWGRPAAEIERAVRAFDPWPGTFTIWGGRTLKVLRAAVGGGEAGQHAGGAGGKRQPQAPPGTVRVAGKRIYVATGEGDLELLSLQPGGRQPVAASDFLNGNPGVDGAVLGG